jgi:anti-sigma factor (TIGR02949 family)
MTEHTHDDPHSDCEQAVSHLYEYLAGELDDASMESVTEHLERCSPCLEAFDFHAELKKVVAHKCSEQMPSGLKHRLLDIAEGGASATDPGGAG